MKVPTTTRFSFRLSNKNHEWPQISVIIIVSLGSLTAAVLFAWPSPSIPQLIFNGSETVNISLEEASYFAVIPPLGSLLASPLVAILMDSIGRKKTILFMSVSHIIAWLLIFFSKCLWVFYVSRIFSGISDAVLFGVIPAYIGEITASHVRGTWGNLNTIFLYIGQFLINVVGAYFSVKTTALFFFIFPITHIILFTFAPESPYYLLVNNKNKEAEESLKLLRWNNNVQEELDLITKAVQRQISESSTLKDLIIIPTNRKALFISIGLRMSQILSGLPAFAVYTQYIFSLSAANLPASTCAIVYTGLFFLMSSTCSFFVDKLSRKWLMIFSSFGCTIALLIESMYFYFILQTNVHLTSYNWIPLAGMSLYIIMFSLGLGILPNLLLSELFSASIKGKATSVVNIIFFLCIIIVPKLFQLLSSNFGMYVPFFVFFCCTCCSTLFSYYFVPETKGKTLEEIQQMLTKKNKIHVAQNSTN
ncbi:hypothetical protein RN001_001350 [Aquatica leii]|uniref:Major facilitator superfamily (MFS) profile domain-containing protein n=1 Tax=Aquatica leii TaxID=1421715 RepID=A0AAN7Q3X7_9COLE|nr:hypothetical protein RN001_001350 [Aquatica leii]